MEEKQGALFCGYCMKRDVKLYMVTEWNKPEKYTYYCQEHYPQVRQFQQKQMQDFLKSFSDQALRERWLSKEQQELYSRLEKELGK